VFEINLQIAVHSAPLESHHVQAVQSLYTETRQRKVRKLGQHKYSQRLWKGNYLQGFRYCPPEQSAEKVLGIQV